MPAKPRGGEAKSDGKPKGEFYYDGQRWSWRGPEVFSIADDTDGDQNRAAYGSRQVDGHGVGLLRPSLAVVILVVIIALLMPESWIGHAAHNMDMIRETVPATRRANVSGDTVTTTAPASFPASGDTVTTTAPARAPASGGVPEARTEIVRWKGLKPQCLGESFVVGVRVVKLRKTADLDSQETARLSPGTRVSLLRPCQNQQGLVRAFLCAVAEDTVARDTGQDAASTVQSSIPSASGRLQFVPGQRGGPRCLEGYRGWATLTAEFIQGPRYFELV
mmetsp:Transcript_49781/g.96144  ORF Transcript_49781/g.96144 Transcript_49781/m.96144 type:complete len:277 (+) Transcript_49781:92-922(+)